MLNDIPWLLSWLLIFAVLLTLFAMGMPVGFAMGLVAAVGLIFSAGLDYVIDLLTNFTYVKISPYIFVCFPLFILMTEIMAHGGISRRLVDLAHKTMGRFPGSLAAVAVVAGAIFGAISGAAAIGVITISDMLLPECMKRGYDKRLIAGAIAAGGTLSFIIPPSFMFILWGIIADVPIGDMFMAGIIPGIMISSMFVVYIVIKAKRNPTLAPMPPSTTTVEKLWAIAQGWQIVLIIVVVIGGVYSGFATVTEISAVAAVTALLIAAVNRELSPRSLIDSFGRTAGLIASFIMIIVGAFLLVHLLNYLEIPYNVSRWVVDAELSSVQLIIAVLLLFFVLGMFIEAGSVMLITTPLFLDSLNRLDVDLIWLGVLIGISCMIAELTPPVGFSLFILQGVGRPHGINFEHIVRGIIPFILILILALAIIILIPGIATWLPSTMDY